MRRWLTIGWILVFVLAVSGAAVLTVLPPSGQDTYALNTARDRDRDGHACE